MLKTHIKAQLLTPDSVTTLLTRHALLILSTWILLLVQTNH